MKPKNGNGQVTSPFLDLIFLSSYHCQGRMWQSWDLKLINLCFIICKVLFIAIDSALQYYEV